jgi:hypothetical protein
MRNPIPAIEWQIAESDADWERLHVAPTPERTPAADPSGRLKHYLAVVATLLVALMGAGSGLWRTDQAALPHPPAGVTATAQSVLEEVGPGRASLVASVIRSLETPSFVFHFRQHDAAAVIAVAPQVDTLYATMRRDFGLPTIPSPEKLVIEVSVTQSPGSALRQPSGADRLVAASPALYLAPAELTDADLLAQSIALPLLEKGLAEASEQHGIGASWQPMLAGLRLWQVWDTDLPLAAWREGIIHWVYLDLPSARRDQPDVLPERYEQLCASHALWMSSPTQLGIPLLCVGLELEEWYSPVWGPRHPPTRLNHIALPAHDPFPHEETRLRGQTVALATIIEYTVATYGHERLPALVAGLGQYTSWATLIPGVFGVSASEFEAGWQAYLVAQYDL